MMKQLLKPQCLTPVVWALGLMAYGIQRVLYGSPVDQTGLLDGNHPLKLAALLLSAGVLALDVLACWDQEDAFPEQPVFAPGVLTFAGYLAAGAGILITVVLNEPLLPGRVGVVWKVLGYISPVCLILAGTARLRGKPVFFGLHAFPCMFFAIHLVDHYQLWCSNPQLQDYFFTLLGTAAMTFFCFQLCAVDVGRGSRRKLLFWLVLAPYLCLGELAMTRELYLFAGSLLWTCGMLWTLPPVQTHRKGGA